jgi:hypothetical protein
MAKAPIVTKENAAEAREQLMAIEAEEIRDRVIAENAKRAEARTVLEPLAAVLAADKLDVAALMEASAALPPEERTLSSLVRSICDCVEGAKKQIERRMADTTPAEVPEAPAA